MRKVIFSTSLPNTIRTNTLRDGRIGEGCHSEQCLNQRFKCSSGEDEETGRGKSLIIHTIHTCRKVLTAMNKVHQQNDGKNIGHQCILAETWKINFILCKSEPEFIVGCELNRVPQNSYADNLISSISERPSRGNRTITNANSQVKMRAIGWSLIQHDCYPYQKGMDTRTPNRGRKMKAETGVMQRSRDARTCQQHLLPHSFRRNHP